MDASSNNCPEVTLSCLPSVYQLPFKASNHLRAEAGPYHIPGTQ